MLILSLLSCFLTIVAYFNPSTGLLFVYDSEGRNCSPSLHPPSSLVDGSRALLKCGSSHQSVKPGNLGSSYSQVPIVHAPTCTTPSVRKEWRTLTSSQKEAWIRSIKCLASLPRSGKLIPTGSRSPSKLIVVPPMDVSSSWYDDFSYVHMDLSNTVHQTGLFLPWHRYFLWSFENTLRTQCNYNGAFPYWNWTQDTKSFYNATIFSPDPLIGLGTFPPAFGNRAVTTGAFSSLYLAYPTPHILHRQYTPYPYVNMSPPVYTGNLEVRAETTFEDGEVRKLIGGWRGDLAGFQTFLEDEKGMHMSVHFIMGGDMSGICPDKPFSRCGHDATPNDPLFWLHHSMIDKIWHDWQHIHPSNYYAFSGVGTIRDLESWPMYPTGRPPAMTVEFSLPNDGILTGNFTVRDMFNTTSGAPLCYTYE